MSHEDERITELEDALDWTREYLAAAEQRAARSAQTIDGLIRERDAAEQRATDAEERAERLAAAIIKYRHALGERVAAESYERPIIDRQTGALTEEERKIVFHAAVAHATEYEARDELWASVDAPATQSDERAVAERAVIAAARRARIIATALRTQKWINVQHEQVEEMIAVLSMPLDVLDAADDATKEATP